MSVNTSLTNCLEVMDCWRIRWEYHSKYYVTTIMLMNKSNCVFTSLMFLVVISLNHMAQLAAWHSGRTSVFGRRTFPVARLAFSWWVTTLWPNHPLEVSQLDKLSLLSSWNDKWVERCSGPQSVVAPSGECLRGKDAGLVESNVCLSVCCGLSLNFFTFLGSRFLQNWHYKNRGPFSQINMFGRFCLDVFVL